MSSETNTPELEQAPELEQELSSTEAPLTALAEAGITGTDEELESGLRQQEPSEAPDPLQQQDQLLDQLMPKSLEDILENPECTDRQKLRVRAIQAQQVGDWFLARGLWVSLAELEPENAQVWFVLGYATERLSDEMGSGRRTWLVRSSEYYQKALELDSGRVSALFNLGNVLAEIARLTMDEEQADRFFLNARRRYRRVCERDEQREEAWYNWAVALADQAQRKTGPTAIRLYALACERYARACQIKPDKHKAYYNWGMALVLHAKELEGPLALKFLDEGIEKYQKALEIDPEKFEAMHNWGIALTAKAQRIKDLEIKRQLFDEAEERFSRALELRAGFLPAIKGLELLYQLRAEALPSS